MHVILLLGENAQQQPATFTDAANYKAANGFSDDFKVMVDPSWQKITGAVQHPNQLGLPFLLMMGGDMEILAIDTNPGAILTEIEKRTGLSVSPSCEGYCGGQALAGCYCDAACVQYNDCCPDYADLCQ